MSVAETVHTTAKALSIEMPAMLLHRKYSSGGESRFGGKCEECRRQNFQGKPLQRKLAVNESGDAFEQEADRVAEQVMRIPEAPTDNESKLCPAAPLVQRKVSDTSATGIGSAPPIVHNVLASTGQPLDAATRSFFEPRFGHDFSNVRVHCNSMAATSARAVGGLAYTLGEHIVFGSGQYTPSTPQGRKVIAHELVHVVQQKTPQLKQAGGLYAWGGSGEKHSNPLPDERSAHPRYAAGDTNGNSDHQITHRQTQPMIQRFGVGDLASSITGFLGIDTDEVAAQITNPINAILTVKRLLSLPLIGDKIRRAVADRLSSGVAQVLDTDNDTLERLSDVFENRDAYFEELHSHMKPYAESMTQVALAEANARLAHLKTMGEPFERVIEAMGDQLAMFPSQWWTILRQILVDQFILWNWDTEYQEFEKLGQELGENIIDSTEYIIGVVRTVLGGMDRVLGAIGLAAFVIGFVGGAATGAGFGGAGAGVVGGVATAGTAAAPSAAVGSGVIGTAGGGLGGGTGAGLFAILGGVSLVGTIAVEAAAVGKSVNELSAGDIPAEQEDRQYQQIAGSILTLAMMAAFALLGAVAGRFAKKMGSKLMQTVRNRRTTSSRNAPEQRHPTKKPPGESPDDVDLDAPVGRHPESPRLRQLIARLDDLRLRSDRRYSGAIESLRGRLTHLMETSGKNAPFDPDNPFGLLDPVAIDDLAQRVETLNDLVGQEIEIPGSPPTVVGQIMLPGGKVPIITDRHSLRGINFGPVEGASSTSTGLPHRVAGIKEEAIPALALPRRVAMHAPREFRGNARAVTRQVLGDPPNVGTAYERVPRIPYDRTIDDPLKGQLYSHIAQGASARVYLMTLRVGGRHRMTAVKHWGPDINENYIKKEVLQATILGELGVGPKVFGLVEIEGRKGLVMEAVAGDFPEAMPPGYQAVWDLEIAKARMDEAGIAIGDFQYFVTPDGRAVIIDAGGAALKGDPRFESFGSQMERTIKSERKRLEFPPPEPELRERLKSQLEDPNRIREKAGTRLADELNRLREGSFPGEISVESVRFSGVRVGQTGDTFWATYSHILNDSQILDRGRLMHLAFEQATIDAARRAGAVKAQVRVHLVTNIKWRDHLTNRGYTLRRVDKTGEKGFQLPLTKEFPTR